MFDGYVDAINATDGSGAHCHMSSLAVCALLTRVGYAPVMQISCRDRNRIAVQGDILGAAAMGVCNLLCLSGDGVQAGDHPQAKPVFDLDAVTLLETARTLRDEHRFLSGRKISYAPRVFLGAAENPSALPLEFRAQRVAKKVAAGAQFIQTQYCYDLERLRAFMRRIEDLGLLGKVFILVGVGPLRSAATADWMRKNVPGPLYPRCRRPAPGRCRPQRAARGPDAVHRADPGDAPDPRRQRRAHHGLSPGTIRTRDRRALRRPRRSQALVSGARPIHSSHEDRSMTETVISSAKREVIIGFDHPFVMIGERINPTGRKILAAEMAAGDFSRVSADALAQVAAGAQMLDVNAGIPLADEPAILARAVQLVQSITDVPLSIDSSIVAALEAGLAVYKGKPLVNSVTGEEERLESVLPLVKKYGAAVVAISNDETGISEDPDVRYSIAKKIVERAADHGIPRSDVVVDPLVMPIGAINLGGTPGHAPAATPAQRTQGQHDLRRLERQFRPAEPQRHQRRVPDHGDRRRTDLRHHEPAPRRGHAGLPGGRCHDGPRPPLRQLDPEVPRTAACRGHGGRRRATRTARGWQPQAARLSAVRLGPAGTGMAEEDALVVFTPSGRRGRFALGTPVLAAARSLGVDVDSVCGGRAMCGRCQITVMEGDFAKHGVKSTAEHLSAVSETELNYGRRRTLAADRRLSCQARIQGDLVIDVPASSQVHRQVVRKAADEREITLNPVVSLHYVEVAEPDMHNPASDLQRLCKALEREWQLVDLECDLSLLPSLQPRLRAGKWAVTVAVHGRKQIIALWPGLHERAFGLAVDIGSTTIAMHLCDLTTGNVLATSGGMNPQIRFGEDLMSRVSYSMMHPEGAQADDGGGARGAQRTRHAGLAGRRGGNGRDPRGRLRRQPDHAPPAARDRSGRARRRAVRALRRRGADHQGRRTGPAAAPECARLRAALHRRPRRRRHRGRHARRTSRPAP